MADVSRIVGVRFRLWLVIVALLVVVAGCGQKGGLYFPDDSEEDRAQATVQP